MNKITKSTVNETKQISYSNELARIIGIEAAVVVAVIDYWCCRNEYDKSENHKRFGAYWMYDSIKELCEHIGGINERTMKRILKKLKANNILFWGKFTTGKNLMWYRINYNKVQALFDGVEEYVDYSAKELDIIKLENKNYIEVSDEIEIIEPKDIENPTVEYSNDNNTIYELANNRKVKLDRNKIDILLSKHSCDFIIDVINSNITEKGCDTRGIKVSNAFGYICNRIESQSKISKTSNNNNNKGKFFDYSDRASEDPWYHERMAAGLEGMKWDEVNHVAYYEGKDD